MGLYSLIIKDVKAENENKRTIVALRILYIIVFIAFIIDSILAGVGVIERYPYRIFLLFAAVIILFIFTYHSRTLPSLILFMLFLIVWTLSMIPCFGWSAGMQNYFIIILMLCFFALYGRTVYKFIYAGFILVLRIMTIWGFGGIKPVVSIEPMTDKLLQITNISAVFISIIFISYVFSRRQNEAENKLMKYNAKLRKEANTDQLTGLFNRRRTRQFLEEIVRDGTYHHVSIAMGDIDFFKKVNDTYGHDTGDNVLIFVADVMREVCPETAFLSRWGGEEFLIILPGHNGDDSLMIIEKLRQTFEQRNVAVGDDEISITMTFGLIEYNLRNEIDDEIKKADEKLYQGKMSGRNKVVY